MIKTNIQMLIISKKLRVQQLILMSQNILGINPFQIHPIQQITQKIIETIQKFSTKNSSIEIQFKYAEFTAFCNSYYDSFDMKDHPQSNDLKKKVNQICAYFVLEQNQLHLDTLKKLSHYTLILLNQLGPRVYRLQGGFDEKIHKKFYKMREFLINLCKQNQENAINGLNFYSEVQKICFNKTFKLLDQFLMRFDIGIKNGQFSGRYSFDNKKGWTRTRKQNLATQYDLMMAEKTFRMAIKKQQQISISPQFVLEAINSSPPLKGQIFLRFKRELRVSKNNQIQLTLSQIYQPDQQRRLECLQDLKDILQSSPDQLQQFCLNVFQQFYMWQPQQSQSINFMQSISKYEIESQFLPEGIKKITQFYKKKQYRELDRFVETALNDLFALSFVDHNIKKRQTTIMNDIIKKKGNQAENFPECRLENQYGSYMHDYIYEYMTQR